MKRISTCNLYSKSLQTHDNKTNSAIYDSRSCFIIVQIFINCIEKLNNYFDKNKRGKNTTKREKLDLCNNMNKDDLKWLDILVNNIYYYKLFSINEQDFLLNIDKYKFVKLNSVPKPNGPAKLVISDIYFIDAVGNITNLFDC